MCKVPYDDVKGYFCDVWDNSAESFLHEIFWDALENAGLTSYTNEKEYALCHVYAFVIQMLCEEYSNMAYDLLCTYDYNIPYKEPLTEAAIGWLYRDVLSKPSYSNIVVDSKIDGCFNTDANEIFSALIFEYRRTVAEPIFKTFGEDLMGKLLFFAVSGHQLETNIFNEEIREFDEVELEMFKTKEELLNYCRNIDCCWSDLVPSDNEFHVGHWLDMHSCAADD